MNIIVTIEARTSEDAVIAMRDVQKMMSDGQLVGKSSTPNSDFSFDVTGKNRETGKWLVKTDDDSQPQLMTDDQIQSYVEFYNDVSLYGDMHAGDVSVDDDEGFDMHMLSGEESFDLSYAY